MCTCMRASVRACAWRARTHACAHAHMISMRRTLCTSVARCSPRDGGRGGPVLLACRHSQARLSKFSCAAFTTRCDNGIQRIPRMARAGKEAELGGSTGMSRSVVLPKVGLGQPWRPRSPPARQQERAHLHGWCNGSSCGLASSCRGQTCVSFPLSVAEGEFKQKATAP